MKIYKILLLSLILFSPLFTGFKAVEKIPFPKISGTNLNGTQINLPEHAAGKMCLVAIAYSLKSQNDLIGWQEPLYKSLYGNIMFPVELYFIPMTGNISGVSVQTIQTKMKDNVDTAFYKYIMLYSGPTQDYIKALKMTDKTKPYFFVINPRGEITYTTSGAYSDKKLEELMDNLSK